MGKEKDFKLDISIVAILMLFMVSTAGTFENPGMQVIIEHWAARGVPVSAVRMMSTIQGVAGLPVILLIGGLVGKRIPYKVAAITGVSCILVGSLAPFFFSESWTLILCFRGLMGIGVGLTACRTPLLLSSVPPEQKTKYMGYAQACTLAVGLVSGPIVGVLSSISWRHVFLINIYTAVILVFMFFIKEPPKAPQSAETAKTGGGFTPIMLKFPVVQLMASALSFPIIVGISTYFAGHGIGNATMAGTVLIFYSLGCTAVSTISKVKNFFKRFTMPFCYGLCLLANLLLLLFPMVPVTIVAVFLFAFGHMGAFSLMQVYAGSAVKPEQVPLASSLLLIGNQLGTFSSTWLMGFAHSIFHLTTDVDSAFALGACVYSILIIIALIPNVIVSKE